MAHQLVKITFPELFEQAPTDLYVLLTDFFNGILEKGQTPEDWSLSILCPIYKKGQMSFPTITVEFHSLIVWQVSTKEL